MLIVPKLILCEIGYYLSISDLVNLRLTNHKVNSCFDLDYFWQQKTKFDFQYQKLDLNYLALYQDLCL